MSEFRDDLLLQRVNTQLGVVTFTATSPVNSSDATNTPQGTFRVVGSVAPWIEKFSPGLQSGDQIHLAEVFAFLDHFIIEAHELFLREGALASLGSGPWSERDVSDEEQSLSATASVIDGTLVIQIRAIPEDLRYHQAMFQKAREYSLSYEKLLKDREQKQILLHTIVHDIASPLMAIGGSLSLLATQGLSSKQQELVNAASEQSSRVTELIKDVLHLFATDLEPFTAASINRDTAPFIAQLLARVVRSYEAVFAAQGIQLQLVKPMQGDVQVIAGSTELFRVFVNLLENTIRYAPSESSVTLALSVEDSGNGEKNVLITVSDEGPGVPAELVPHLFNLFAGGRKYGGKSGLGLYYCKTCLNRWGGDISYLHKADRCEFQVSLRQLI